MIEAKEYSEKILIRELVHQWIGNLVTIDDWNELCVQEAITEYYAKRLISNRKTLAPPIHLRGDMETFALTQLSLLVDNITRDIDAWQTRCYNSEPFERLEKELGTAKFDVVWRTLLQKYAYGNVNTKIIASEMGNAKMKPDGN